MKSTKQPSIGPKPTVAYHWPKHPVLVIFVGNRNTLVDPDFAVKAHLAAKNWYSSSMSV